MNGVVAEAKALSRTYPIGGGLFSKPAQLHVYKTVTGYFEEKLR